MDEDIRRKGMLYLHQQRFGKKWRKTWCVLVAEGRRSVARLELYEHKHMSMKQGSTKHKPDHKQVIRLRDCIRITENTMSDCPKDCAPFVMETSEKLFLFASHVSEVNGWIRALCEQAFPDSKQHWCTEVVCDKAGETHENSIYDSADKVQEFQVVAMRTEAGVRCKLFGDFILTPLNDCIRLKDCISKDVLYTWPYCFIRKFSQDTLTFSFEAGRRCTSGEGTFEFATHQADKLFNMTNIAIKNLPKSKAKKSLDGVGQEEQDTGHQAEAHKLQGDPEPQVIPKEKVQKTPKMLKAMPRSFSLNAIELQHECPDEKFNCSSQNEEPVYAIVSKAPSRNTSITRSPKQLQHVHNVLQDNYGLDPSFAIPQQECEEDETEPGDVMDLLGYSIQQLAFNEDSLGNNSEAIYADPLDCESSGNRDVSPVYDEPEMIFKAERLSATEDPQKLFTYSNKFNYEMSLTASTNSIEKSDDMLSVYDNLKLKEMPM